MGESNLPHVLCPLCVRPGGLSLHLEFVSKPIGILGQLGAQAKLSVRRIPVLSCSLEGCGLILVGVVDDNGDAVFPDPHVQAPRA